MDCPKVWSSGGTVPGQRHNAVAELTQPDKTTFPSLLGSIPCTVEYESRDGFATPVAVRIAGRSASLLGDACHFSDCQLKAWEREARAVHVERCDGEFEVEPRNAFDDTEHCAAVALGAYIDRIDAQHEARAKDAA
jgi:hypothetical protein